MDKVALSEERRSTPTFSNSDLIDELYLTIEPVDFRRWIDVSLSARDDIKTLNSGVESYQSMNEEGTFLRHYEPENSITSPPNGLCSKSLRTGYVTFPVWGS